MSQLIQKVREVEAQMNNVILGKPELIRSFMTGVLARGHILLEGLPGLGKTQMIKAFSLLCNMVSTRIQFTPDLMPMDITGTNILNEYDGIREMQFTPGPIFGNMVLADEINRASPKTQSALLEAMQERRVTVLGKTHDLPEPFMVLATQNPIELEGTYPLPEAQVDRFLFKLNVSDVDAKVLTEILTSLEDGELPALNHILTRDEMILAMNEAKAVIMSEPIASYIARLVSATHPDNQSENIKFIRFGASPRAAISMSKAARARAYLDGRNTVGFEDVKDVAFPVLRHRIILDYSARIEGITPDSVVEKILLEVSELERSAPSSVVERLVNETE